MSSQSKIQEKMYSYTDFEYNFVKIFKQKSKLLKNGIVFVGNSRIGKSTLACILANIEMQIIKNQHQQARLEPVKLQYRQAVKHTKDSVTQIPNVYKIDNQDISIIDLPGFLDSSYFREICNLHYIKTILSSLQKICFIMVIEIHNKQKKLLDKQLQMMDRFYTMFPQAASNTIIVINMLNPKSQDSDKEKIIQNISKQINEADFTKDNQKKKFFIQLFRNKSKFHFIKKVDFQTAQNPQKIMHDQLQKFIKNNKKHMQKMDEIQYKIKFDEFKTQTKGIKLLLQKIVEQSFKNIKQCIKILKKTFQMSVSSYAKKQKIDPMETLKIQRDLQDFIKCHKADRQFNVLVQVHRQLISQIFNNQTNQNHNNSSSNASNNLSQTDDSLFEIVNQISQYIDGDQALKKVVNKLKKIIEHLYLILPSCQTELKVILLYLVSKSQELGFLQSGVQNFDASNLDVSGYQGKFFDLLAEHKADIPPQLRNMDKQVLQNLQIIQTKSYQKLQKTSLNLKPQQKRRKINILIKCCSKLSNQKLLQKLQISKFKICYQEIAFMELQQDEKQRKAFQKNIKQISQYLQNLVNKDRQRENIQNWKKQNRKWKSLKLKVYQKFAQYFKLHSKIDQVLSCYQNLNNYHQQIYDIIIMKIPQRSLQQKRAKYTKLMQTSKTFLKSVRFQLALKCYTQSSKLFRNQYEQVQKYREAQKMIIQHWRCISNDLNQNKGNASYSYEEYKNNYQKRIKEEQNNMNFDVISQDQFDRVFYVVKEDVLTNGHLHFGHSYSYSNNNDNHNYLKANNYNGNGINAEDQGFLQNSYYKHQHQPQLTHASSQKYSNSGNTSGIDTSFDNKASKKVNPQIAKISQKIQQNSGKQFSKRKQMIIQTESVEKKNKQPISAKCQKKQPQLQHNYGRSSPAFEVKVMPATTQNVTKKVFNFSSFENKK